MKKLSYRILFFPALAALFGAFFVGLSQCEAAEKKVTLVLGAFTAPREAYKKIIPKFQEEWKKKTGQTVEFQESYLGSGAQSRAIVAGFEADVAALSLETDVDRIAEKGLITRDWRKAEGGFVTTSVVVIAVRPGNPKKVRDWKDLAGQKVEILTPNPKTSGGAQWNALAAYGAAKRGKVPGYEASDDGAKKFLVDLFRNVTALDKGARESLINFENGVGDAAITYESEVLAAKKEGRPEDYVTPSSTILIQNPVAVVDASVDKHGTRAVAEAFVAFLFSVEAQQIFAEEGFYPVDIEVAHRFGKQYRPAKDLWEIKELGVWKEVSKKYFGQGGVYDQVMEEVQKKK